MPEAGNPLRLTKKFMTYVGLGSRYLHLRFIRPLLPKGDYIEINGHDIISRKHRVAPLDNTVPWSVPSNPNWDVSLDTYKQSACSLIHQEAESGMTAAIIGGGFGISSYEMAGQVGPDGLVRVYEVSAERCQIIERTSETKCIQNIETVNKCVGPVISGGPDQTGEAIDPSELRNFDILELDCEGAEKPILENMLGEPNSIKKIIVETHPDNGAGTPEIKNILAEGGFSIQSQKGDLNGHVIYAKKQ